jgi:hypothetical protein
VVRIIAQVVEVAQVDQDHLVLILLLLVVLDNLSPHLLLHYFPVSQHLGKLLLDQQDFMVEVVVEAKDHQVTHQKDLQVDPEVVEQVV